MVELADALPQVGGLSTKTYQVTTGAAPVDFELPDSTYSRIKVEVTSGGTAGEEIINLISPDIVNIGNPDYNGIEITFVMVGLTDPSDTVAIKCNGDFSGHFYNPMERWIRVPSYSKIWLGYLGEAILMKWCYDSWQCDLNATNWNFTYTVNVNKLTFRGDAGLAFDFAFAGLPSSDPAVGGQLWNDATTAKISAG